MNIINPKKVTIEVEETTINYFVKGILFGLGFWMALTVCNVVLMLILTGLKGI